MNHSERILGNVIDGINGLIRGIVMFFVVITFHFWNYQDGRGDFALARCMLIFVCAFGALAAQKCRSHFRSGGWQTVVLPVAACIGVNWILSRCMGATGRSFFLVSLFPLVEDAVIRYRLRENGNQTDTKRNYECSLSSKYGIVLGLVALFAVLEANAPSAEFPISSDRLTTVFYLFFVVYFSLLVLLKYVKMQYVEARKYRVCGSDFVKRQLKVDAIVLTFSLVLFLPSVYVVQNTIFVPLCMLIARLFLGLFNAGVSVVSENLVEKFLGLLSMTDKVAVVESGGTRRMVNTGLNFNVFMVLVVVVVALLAVALILALMKLYKVKGVSYKGEEEEAVYVEEREFVVYDTEKIVFGKQNFPNDNNGRVRKLYYRYMNNKISRSMLKEAQSSTPLELKEKFRNHDDERGKGAYA